jgi:6,7-dimethyl-8-ribityllumazine synthase
MSETADKERVLLVAAPYYADIVEELVTGATRALEAAGFAVARIDAPGAFEIPAAIAAAEHAHTHTAGFAGYVALGCVIRGETSHYDHICNEVARAIMHLTVRERLSIGFGVLTVEKEAQARARAAVDGKDKGGEAARAAIAMIGLRAKLARGWP